MRKGTIVLTPFPFTDLKGQAVRPAVVVSKSTRTGNDVILAFISSVTPKTLLETDLPLRKNHTDFKNTGLKKDSVVKCDKLATVSKEIILGELGHLTLNLIKEMNKKLRLALEL